MNERESRRQRKPVDVHPAFRGVRTIFASQTPTRGVSTGSPSRIGGNVETPLVGVWRTTLIAKIARTPCIQLNIDEYERIRYTAPGKTSRIAICQGKNYEKCTAVCCPVASYHCRCDGIQHCQSYTGTECIGDANSCAMDACAAAY